MNLEGGVGADFLKGGLTAGLNYYASFKLTDDQFDGVPDIVRGKNRVFAAEAFEAKPAEWKMCFRAGKPATDAARAFAQKWLNDLQGQGVK